LRSCERKLEDVFGEDQFGFRKRERNWGCNWDAGIISERALDIDEVL
jgi:hypothetical protein